MAGRFVTIGRLQLPFRPLLFAFVVLPLCAALCYVVVFLPIDPFGWLYGFHGGYPEWSPDGKRIVFRCDQEDVYEGGVCVRSVAHDERRMIRPWSGFYPMIRSAWSPDGSKILSSGFGVRVLNPDGTGERTLSDSGYPGAAWSPDGSRIAYADGSLNVMNADGGGGKRRLTRGDNPAWSPDGKRLLFDDGPSYDDDPGGQKRALFVAGVDAGDQTPRRALGPGWDGVWSPDGRRIAFVSKGTYYGGSIYVMNADGSGRKQLTTGTQDTGPRWSPDGKRLAYVREHSDVCLLYPDVGRIEFVANGQDPAFSPDGKRLAFADEDAGVSRIRIIELGAP